MKLSNFAEQISDKILEWILACPDQINIWYFKYWMNALLHLSVFEVVSKTWQIMN